MDNKIIIYTDGACSGNPGPGGWAAILKKGDYEKELSDGAKATTNNRMELTAVIEGLKALTKPSEVILYTDSKYVCDAIVKNWIANWRRDGWTKKGGLKNSEMWQELDALLKKHRVEFKWVKGHADNEYNNRCDKLACIQRDRYAVTPAPKKENKTPEIVVKTPEKVKKPAETAGKKPIFTGIGTAMVTPMTDTGAIDYLALERLVDRQIAAGIDALIICATTGEAPTLGDEEHIEAVKMVVRQVQGRIPVIAGTGSNDTAHAVEMSIKARDVGADGLLCVTPYYNKCTQRGIVESYFKIADATELPMIVYNVPSRTGVNILPETYERLSEHDRIVGIKEANGDISSVVDTLRRVKGRLALYSGNDDQTVPIMSMGGLGCISVLSNLIPAETKRMTELFFAGDLAGAAEKQMRYKPLIDALFSQVNPIPIKAALSELGLCSDYVRMPLSPMEDDLRKRLREIMEQEGIKA